jgi:predicted phosphodiesterase
VRVFAVEPTAVQIDWHRLAPGRHEVAAGTRAVTVESDGGPGAVVIDGLAPGATVDITLNGRVVDRATTLTPPPGRLLIRVATISDLHLGENTFGHLPRCVSSDEAATAHPVFCTRAAIRELVAWGAELLIVKGDIAHDNHVDEYDLAATLLRDVPIPMMVIPGNHDGGNRRRHDPTRALAKHGIELIDGVGVVDVPGLRIVGVDTRTDKQGGTVVAVTPAVLDALAGAPAPGALVAMHHNLMTTPVPTFPPPGVPSRQAVRYLDAIAAAHPTTIVTSGHTHRHRARRHGPLLVTEVGSPKDYPGTWGGYLVYEGGVVQTVRRVMAPDAIRWTDTTARMFGGAWGRWSPGRLDDRCVSHSW